MAQLLLSSCNISRCINQCGRSAGDNILHIPLMFCFTEMSELLLLADLVKQQESSIIRIPCDLKLEIHGGGGVSRGLKNRDG